MAFCSVLVHFISSIRNVYFSFHVFLITLSLGSWAGQSDYVYDEVSGYVLGS